MRLAAYSSLKSLSLPAVAGLAVVVALSGCSPAGPAGPAEPPLAAAPAPSADGEAVVTGSRIPRNPNTVGPGISTVRPDDAPSQIDAGGIIQRTLWPSVQTR